MSHLQLISVSRYRGRTCEKNARKAHDPRRPSAFVAGDGAIGRSGFIHGENSLTRGLDCPVGCTGPAGATRGFREIHYLSCKRVSALLHFRWRDERNGRARRAPGAPPLKLYRRGGALRRAARYNKVRRRGYRRGWPYLSFSFSLFHSPLARETIKRNI